VTDTASEVAARKQGAYHDNRCIAVWHRRFSALLAGTRHRRDSQVPWLRSWETFRPTATLSL
jgi:hypothetical protein